MGLFGVLEMALLSGRQAGALPHANSLPLDLVRAAWSWCEQHSCRPGTSASACPFGLQLSWEGRGFLGSTKARWGPWWPFGQCQMGGSCGSWPEKQAPFSIHAVWFCAPRKWVEDYTYGEHTTKEKQNNNNKPILVSHSFPGPSRNKCSPLCYFGYYCWMLIGTRKKTKGLPSRKFTCTCPYEAAPLCDASQVWWGVGWGWGWCVKPDKRIASNHAWLPAPVSHPRHGTCFLQVVIHLPSGKF